MPKRTIGMQSLRVRPGRNRKKQFAKLTDVEGLDLLYIFHNWVQSIAPDDLVDHQRGRYVHVTRVTPTGRNVLVELEAGYFGVAGQTFDTATHTVSHKRSARESATVMTRLLFTVAPDSEVGVFTSEREGTSGAGPELVRRFREALLEHFSTYAFEVETVVESPAWAQGADLLAVSAVAYAVPVDLAQGVIAQGSVLGTLEQRLEPMKGERFLPSAILAALQNGKIKASDFLGFPDGRDIDDTFVRVSRNGREKKYSLDKQRVPSVRIVLTEDGAPPLTRTDFLRECQTEVQDFYEGLGFTWNDSWRSGTWTPEALKENMPAHDEA